MICLVLTVHQRGGRQDRFPKIWHWAGYSPNQIIMTGHHRCIVSDTQFLFLTYTILVDTRSWTAEASDSGQECSLCYCRFGMYPAQPVSQYVTTGHRGLHWCQYTFIIHFLQGQKAHSLFLHVSFGLSQVYGILWPILGYLSNMGMPWKRIGKRAFGQSSFNNFWMPFCAWLAMH